MLNPHTFSGEPEMATLPATILGKTDVPFYANAQMIIQKII